MDLDGLIGRARRGDLDAFAEATRRFQHMAFGYALALVRDLQQAEDVVQDAFVAAWFGLSSLAEPAAFPGWLRGIVHHQAHRRLRRRHLETLPLAAAEDLPAAEPGPDQHAEQAERIRAMLGAIARLPAPLREVVTLFYVHDCTQQDIATFLGLSATTVNNRLHAARTELKRRTLTMVKDTLEAHRLPDDFASRIGRIIRTHEGVIEARFDPTRLPDVLEELTVSDNAGRRPITVQVMQSREDGLVRCIALAPEAGPLAAGIEGVAPGSSVLSSGRRTEATQSRERLDDAVRVLAGPAAARREVSETGIKVIDVMCPLAKGGTAAIAGEYKAGTMVLVEELVRRLGAGPGGVSLFTFVPPGPGPSFREMWEKEGFSNGTVGSVQTFFFAGEAEWTAARLSELPAVDVVVRLSRKLAGVGIYPPVDAIVSRSRLLDERVAPDGDTTLAERIRELLTAERAELEAATLSPDAPVMARRARKLQRFFAQPFFVAEPYTKTPGATVPRADAIQACRDILDGRFDDLPEAAFYFVGGMDEVRAKAERLAGGA